MTLFLKRIFLFPLYFITGIYMSNGQNLAVNGNFETYTTLPNYYAQSCYATGWQSPSGGCALVVGQGSPDYYHTLGSSGAKPPATWWSNVMPHTGNAMQGFCGWYTSSGSYREYVQYHLNTPMVPNVSYEISYYITNGTTTFHGYGCNHIGAYFSTTAVTQSGGNPMPYIPQVQDTGIFFSTTWQKKTFLFTPSQPYNYITIGNFYNNINSAITQFVFPSTVVGAYYYIDDVVVKPATTLPVEIISFSGENNNNINHLQWTTASEINNDYYDVEKSTDGIYFSKAGIVQGNGSSSQPLHYNFYDRFPINNTNYYRLKQVDYNGEYAYSPTIVVKNNVVQNSIWFASSNDPGTYILHFKETKFIFLKITDMSGRTLEQIGVKNPDTELKLDLRKYTNGIYIINIFDGFSYQNIRLVRD